MFRKKIRTQELQNNINQLHKRLMPRAVNRQKVQKLRILPGRHLRNQLHVPQLEYQDVL